MAKQSVKKENGVTFYTDGSKINSKVGTVVAALLDSNVFQKMENG